LTGLSGCMGCAGLKGVFDRIYKINRINMKGILHYGYSTCFDCTHFPDLFEL
jgi:hypothetical protein